MDKTNIAQRITARSMRGWLYEILAIVGIAGPFFLLYAGFVSLFSAGDYNPIHDSISSLAWTGWGWFQNIGFIVTGFFMEVFAAILYLSMKGARGFGLGSILLACSGFLLLFVGLFPTVAAILLVLFRQLTSTSGIHTLLNLPLALQEMVLAVWLIARGFNPSASMLPRERAA